MAKYKIDVITSGEKVLITVLDEESRLKETQLILLTREEALKLSNNLTRAINQVLDNIKLKEMD